MTDYTAKLIDILLKCEDIDKAIMVAATIIDDQARQECESKQSSYAPPIDCQTSLSLDMLPLL